MIQAIQRQFEIDGVNDFKRSIEMIAALQKFPQEDKFFAEDIAFQTRERVCSKFLVDNVIVAEIDVRKVIDAGIDRHVLGFAYVPSENYPNMRGLLPFKGSFERDEFYPFMMYCYTRGSLASPRAELLIPTTIVDDSGVEVGAERENYDKLSGLMRAGGQGLYPRHNPCAGSEGLSSAACAGEPDCRAIFPALPSRPAGRPFRYAAAFLPTCARNAAAC